MRWFRTQLFVCSFVAPPWLVLAFVCAFARSSYAAPDATGVTNTCGTQFTDTQSSALLADIVLEGRVREKIPLPGSDNDDSNNSPQGRGEGAVGGSGRYKVVIQVRTKIWKGQDLVDLGKRRKITLGTFAPQADTGDDVSNVVAVRPAGSGAVSGDGVNDPCIGDVADGATYIFFLRDVGDRKRTHFELSALPVKKNRREARLVSKIFKKNGAQVPEIQSVKAPKSVTTGSSLTLRCKAKAKPNPVFQWFHNGQEIVTGRGKRIQNTKRGSRLKISKAELDHSGIYVCVASNAVGEASQNVTVKVTAPQKIYKACEKQTYCFNGGTCRYISEMHQTFCECPESYEGKRCEKQIAHPSMIVPGEATLLYERTLIIIGIVVALLVFVVICIASYCLANRRRKRFEKNRRLRRQQGPEADALLDKTDGHGGIPQPQFAPVPSYKPLAQKETQTDLVFHPPDIPPPKREHESEPNFSHPNNIFLRDNSFPLMNAAPTAPPPQPPPYLNGQRPKSDREPPAVQRRGSRSRLKAVSVDDNCKDRPKSWKASEVPDSMSMPVITAGQSPEIMQLPKSDSSPGPERAGEPREGYPWRREDLLPPEANSPVRMETQPRANAHAQLKTPEEREAESDAAVLPMDTGDVTEPWLPPKVDASGPFFNSAWLERNPVNGVLHDSDCDDMEASPLPPLHISEEDLNGNVAKPNKQPDDQTSPTSYRPKAAPSSPPAFRPKELPDALGDGSYVPGFGVGFSPVSPSEEDSGGFQPQALSSSEGANSSALATPVTETYAFDPCMDSDPNEFDEQFMHGSPKKTVYGGADDKQDHERRLRNVRTDQEAIPI